MAALFVTKQKKCVTTICNRYCTQDIAKFWPRLPQGLRYWEIVRFWERLAKEFLSPVQILVKSCRVFDQNKG